MPTVISVICFNLFADFDYDNGIISFPNLPPAPVYQRALSDDFRILPLSVQKQTIKQLRLVFDAVRSAYNG